MPRDDTSTAHDPAGYVAAIRRRLPQLFPSGRVTDATEFDGWGFLWKPAIIGLFALIAIAIGSSFSNSPFKPEVPHAWFFGAPTKSVPPFSTQNSTTMLLGITLVYGGLVLLIRTWFRLAEVVRHHPGAPVGKLGWILGLWIVPMLGIAPVFSRDVYSYAAEGEMVTRHINPYVYGPSTLGSGPFPDMVDKLWRYVPSAYGNLFLWIDGGIARVTGHSPLWSIVGLRALEVIAVVILAIALPILARAHGLDAGNAFVLCLLNPLVVLTLVGGAHNDALMVALLVAGLALAAKKHPVLGIVACALATSVKAPAALGIVYIAWDWLGSGLPVRLRLRPLAIAAILAGAVLGACAWASGLGFGWIRNLNTPGHVVSWMSPATGLGMGLAGVTHVLGFSLATSSAIAVTRDIGLVASIALVVWLLFNADRIGWLKALGLSLVVIVVLGPVVQPWYLTWGLLLLLPVATGRLRVAAIALSVVSPFVGLPGGADLLKGIVHAPMLETGFVLFLLWTLLGAPLGRWTSHGRSVGELAPLPPLTELQRAA